jgi:hypothetical protein
MSKVAIGKYALYSAGNGTVCRGRDSLAVAALSASE